MDNPTFVNDSNAGVVLTRYSVKDGGSGDSVPTTIPSTSEHGENNIDNDNHDNTKIPNTSDENDDTKKSNTPEEKPENTETGSPGKANENGEFLLLFIYNQ